MTVTLATPDVINTPPASAYQHPPWCQRYGTGEDCWACDVDFDVLHFAGDRFVAAANVRFEPIEISVDLWHAVRQGSGVEETKIELLLPGGYADLTKEQALLLIAELNHFVSQMGL